MEQLDFVAIGDTVTDAFIKLKDPSAHIDIDHEVREICLRFADKVPYEDVFVIPAVGNSANAAVAASRLGLKTAIVTNVGKDYHGDECIAALKNEGVGVDFVNKEEGKRTNYHYVLWYGDDRTILIKHEDYAYDLPDIGEPKWIYFSSVGESGLEFHSVVLKYLEAHPNTKLAFQPGTFQMKHKNDIWPVYQRADIIFCNKEEAQRILDTKDSDIASLLAALHGVGAKIAVITDGVKGAYSYDGTKTLFMRPYPDPKPPYERTGAGDAFSSTVVAALALGKPLEEALRWGPVNSMSVVQYVGAREGLLTHNGLSRLLTQGPADYRPVTI